MKRPLSSLAAMILLAAAAGCGGGASKSAVITAPPSDWSTLAGKPSTFEGRAGNSAKGPLLRLEDGYVLGLSNISMWPVTYVGRGVGVGGTVVVGEGQRSGEYVLRVERWYLVKEPVDTQKTTAQPAEPTVQEQEFKMPRRRKANKPE